MNRLFYASAAALAASIITATTCHADDRPLIWKPSKDSDTSYSARLGFKLPDRLETEAGVSMGVNTTKNGTPVDVPISFWGKFVAEKIKTPASEIRRGVGVDLDGRTGGAAISMNYYEKEIATPAIDIERNSSYAMRYDGATGEWCSDASQSVRLSHDETGTALIGRVSGANSFKTVGAGMGVEQKIGKHMMLSGTIDRMSDADKPVTSINARYSFKW